MLILLILVIASAKVPVIGVLIKNYSEISNIPYYGFEAVYVRFLQQSGAIAVPIFFNDTEQQILGTLDKINGVLFTGGSMEFNEFDIQGNPVNLTRFGRVGKLIYDRVIEKNKAGIYFPLWGTCMGFQLIAVAATMNLSINYSPADSQSELGTWYTSVIYNKSQTSRLLNSMSPINLYAMETQNITFNSHHYMVDAEMLAKSSSELKLIASSKSRQGKYEFAVILEGVNAPIYGTQFHPEIRYTLALNNITYISIGQEMSNFFVAEARKNNQSFSNAEFESKIIYKSASTSNYGGQMYLIPIANHT